MENTDRYRLYKYTVHDETSKFDPPLYESMAAMHAGKFDLN
jgi:hypothetical protein